MRIVQARSCNYLHILSQQEDKQQGKTLVQRELKGKIVQEQTPFREGEGKHSLRERVRGRMRTDGCDRGQPVCVCVCI